MKLVHRIVLPAYLFLCIVLGGASAGGYFENLALQLVAVCLLVAAVWTWPRRTLLPQERRFLILICAGWLVFAVQLIPLPHSLWDQLPMRKMIDEDARMAGVLPNPLFLTLMPHETIKSAVWLLPATGLSIAMIRLRFYRADYFAWSLLLATTLSVILGALQLSGGLDSPWYFYSFTNWGWTVGFFANSNHLATLLLVSIPFLAALVRSYRSYREDTMGLRWLIGLVFLAIITAGLYMNGSLAGYSLALPVVGFSAAILFPGKWQRSVAAILFIPMIVAGLALALATEEGARLLAEGETVSPARRDVIFANTWTAIRDFFPAGSGSGSFAEIYRMYEGPSIGMRSYVNHAHNDYLELLLETGVIGALVLATFLIWWGWRAIRIWTARDLEAFPSAAVIASGTILVHSVVDYPLRTGAISAVIAMCCIFMIDWVSSTPLEESTPPPRDDKPAQRTGFPSGAIILPD